MKKWVLFVFLLVLIVGFSTGALAVDVKFSGEYYAAGMYLDKTSFKKNVVDEGPSTAFYFQRLRVRTDFIVSPGLSLITRFDAMERVWGAARSAPSTVLDNRSAGTTAENQNIAFDWAYLQYASPIGIVAAGYMSDGTWGTVFGNNARTAAKLSYTTNMLGNFTLIAQAVKFVDNDVSAIKPVGYTDADNNVYYLMGIYAWKTGQAGVLGVFARNATTRPASAYKAQYYLIEPYVIAQLGPVKIEAELQYGGGKLREYDSGSGQQDISLSNWAGWLDVTVAFNPVYIGGTFAYVSGDDPNTLDKAEGGVLAGGDDFNPCLILWNFDRRYWAGALAGYGTATNNTSMANALFYQGRVGVRPMEKLDIMASVSYAYADKKPTGYASGEYGWELDVTGTYKITNNLSYMLGVGYLFTGDYFKADTTGADLRNDYIVMNKLTLTF